jgi:integrase
MPPSNRPPSYRLHKARDCAVATINGKNFYLGRHGSPESYEKYARLIASWQMHGGQLPPTKEELAQGKVTVNQLILQYLKFADGYYRKHGRRTGEFDNIRCALRPLKQLYGRTLGKDFGPSELKLVRQEMIAVGLARRNINGRISRIKRMFRWGSREGMIPAEIYFGPTAVEGLKRDRSAARETLPAKPVPEEHVQGSLPHVNRQLRAMIGVQELSGMRPQDVRNPRTYDLDTSGDVWIYTPWTHKTEHHGHERKIAIGPKAQVILRPFLKPDDPKAFIFGPREAVEEMHAERRLRRKTKRTPSELRRRRKTQPTRGAWCARWSGSSARAGWSFASSPTGGPTCSVARIARGRSEFSTTGCGAFETRGLAGNCRAS